MRELWTLLRETAFGFVRDNGMQLAAAVAFYALLSLAPATFLILDTVGRVLGREAAQAELVHQVDEWIGHDGSAVVRTIAEQTQRPVGRGLSTVFGLAMLVVAGTAVFVQLQTAMNAIWNVQPMPGKEVWHFFKKRLLSLAMLIVAALLMILSLVFTSVVRVVLGSVHADVVYQGLLLRSANLGGSLVVFTALFAVMFKTLPDVKVPWRHVWLGGLVTAGLFLLGREGIAILLQRSTAPSAYGAAGSLVVVLLWIYYSSIIIFIGAEFTQNYTARHGGAAPERGAARAHD
jgi:membrane protein